MLWLVLAANATAAPDVLVVCPAELRDALAPWEQWRRDQGHQLAVIEPPQSAEALHARVRQLAQGGQLKYVLLVGDVDGATRVPTSHVDARVNVRWGSEQRIATDQVYADVDHDQRPDVAIGRIPVDTPAELRVVVRKILRYEQQPRRGSWQRRVNIVAGAGGFGPVADALIEAAARRVIDECVPADYDVIPTFAGASHSHGVAAAKLRPLVDRQFREGCLMWVYLGHARRTELDCLASPAGGRSILSVDDAAQLPGGNRSPVVALVACYAGAFDAPDDCLAEALLRAEQGPVAVLAATRVTMPYGNTVLGYELLRATFDDRTRPLGEALRVAQRRTLTDGSGDPLRDSLDAVARGMTPAAADVASERREHVWMYHLLGDPLLVLRHPPLQIAGEETRPSTRR